MCVSQSKTRTTVPEKGYLVKLPRFQKKHKQTSIPRTCGGLTGLKADVDGMSLSESVRAAGNPGGTLFAGSGPNPGGCGGASPGGRQATDDTAGRIVDADESESAVRSACRKKT